MNYTANIEKFWQVLTPVIDSGARARIERICQQNSESVPVSIAQLGLAPDDVVVKAYETAFNIKQISETQLPENPEFSNGISSAFLKARRLIPYKHSNGVGLAMVDPTDDEACLGVAFATGFSPAKSVISLTDWRAAFERLYGFGSSNNSDTSSSKTLRAGWADDETRLKDMASEAPVIRKVERLLTEAADIGASDIHVEPGPNVTRIRFRVDGQMRPPVEDTPDVAALIVSRVKVMCDMDVADSRRPQDGRTSTAVRGRPIDLRVSTVPTAYGESLAIRLLDRTASLLDLDNLGFSEGDLNLITRILENPKGIFLVTGPTGSGKTTTLYAALNRLRKVARKILTVEDPIEYFFEDVNQVQVNEAAGVTFATALRSFLRQDPDIMMVGEIRDGETARVAVQAALTGHLVLSTLHTNDAVSAIARLKDMGIEDYLIAATLSGVTAQRLVRKLCPDCRTPVKSSKHQQFLASGCPKCSGDGYSGRTVISEGYLCSADISDLIRQGISEDKIFAQALKQGMVPLLEDGRTKAANGHVALQDVYAAVGQE